MKIRIEQRVVRGDCILKGYVDGVLVSLYELTWRLTRTTSDSDAGIFATGHVRYTRNDGRTRMFGQVEPGIALTTEIIKKRIAAVRDWAFENDKTTVLEFEIEEYDYGGII